MPLKPFVLTPEQVTGLEQLCSVVIAEFDGSGGLLHGNAGFYRVTAANSASLWQLFSQPQAETLLTAAPDCDGRIYSGLMTARGPGDTMISLMGSIYRDADRVLVVAGYDMNEFEVLTRSLLDLNNRVNVAYRELARTNRKLEISEQQIRQLSLTDALTGVGNRRRLDEALVMEVDRSARYQAPLSLMVLDIDHFKRVNDTWGHETGDRILKDTGAVLRTMARRTDIATRMGGEEFVVLLPETDLEIALGCAERLRAALEVRDCGLPAPVTSSFGVACLQPGESGASLLARADAALYAAKQAGRNRVAAAEPLEA
jgi:two-component system cell cycle response regulator